MSEYRIPGTNFILEEHRGSLDGRGINGHELAQPQAGGPALGAPESRDAGLHREWDSLVQQRANPYGLYQSPVWFDYLREVDPENLLPLLSLRDQAANLVGVVPLLRRSYRLETSIWHVPIVRANLCCAEILGGVPAISDSREAHDELFTRLLRAAPECDGLYLHSVPTHSSTSRYLHQRHVLGDDGFVLSIDGPRNFHAIELPSTFDAYLGQFRSKKRYNLRRQVRMFRRWWGGRIRLVRVETEEQIPAFLEAATEVLRHCWQVKHHLTTPYRILSDARFLRAQARRKILRGYVLYGGETPCAFVIGTQYAGVFHYAEVAYDGRMAELSPGSVMLYLLIADLIAHRPARLVNFGITESRYKRELSNLVYQEELLLVLKASPCSIWKHSLWNAVIQTKHFFKSRLVQPRTLLHPDKPTCLAAGPSENGRYHLSSRSA